MKNQVIVTSLFIICFSLFSFNSFSQTINSDTTLAGQYCNRAKYLLDQRQFNKFDSILNYSQQSAFLYSKYKVWKGLMESLCNQIQVSARKINEKITKDLFDSISNFSQKQFGNKNAYLAYGYHYLGWLYNNLSKNDLALENYFKALELRQALLGEKNIDVATTYNALGIVYDDKTQYDKALDYYMKSLNIRKELLGEKHIEVANSCMNIGIAHQKKREYDKALDYYFKALEIRIEILGEKHPDIAMSHFTIGNVYYSKGEYDKALEYFLKSLIIRREILGEKHPDVARSYNNIGVVYSGKGEYDKGLEYYIKALQIRKEILGEKHPEVATNYVNIGTIYDYIGGYDRALESFNKALQISKEIFGEKHLYVAIIYNNIGSAYYGKGEYDKALGYHIRALQLRKEKLGERHPDVALSYINIGSIYDHKGEFNRALEYYLKALQINKEILGEKHLNVGRNYIHIGNIYFKKGEYDKALEYDFQALQINKEILGEKHPVIAGCYQNIGNDYSNKGEFDKALEYFLKSLPLNKDILGEKHLNVAANYNNIGNIYRIKCEYDKALEYHIKALLIKKEIVGEKNLDVAGSYENIGNVYTSKGDYDMALEYHFKTLQISKEILGEKHPDVARSYENIGNVYNNRGNCDKALEYYQKGAASCLRNFNDTANVHTVPAITDILDWNYLLHALQVKAEILCDNRKILTDLVYDDRKKIALRYYQACDTLIDISRKEISTQSDKLALGEKSSPVYKGAIDLLTSFQPSNKTGIVKTISDKDANLAFYFSEKNKSSVLLEALAGQEAIKFAGIPDSLLEKEHNLKIEIDFYTKKLADPEKLDSAKTALFRNELFSNNRKYDSLIIVFEKQFPEYYTLKYNNKSVPVKDIQKLLDKKTALRSYVVGDSTITIFTLTRSNLEVQKVPKITNLNDSITWFRYGLTKTSLRMQENFRSLGYNLYQQLFPQSALIDKQIENLIIIPDGELAIIPFETLLTSNYTGDINVYNEYPYLIKKYKISYSYSANLFHLTFSKKASSTVEIKKLNDFLAFAPVFDNSKEQNMTISSQELQHQLSGLKTDSTMMNRSMFDRSYITPLPATETEAGTIFKLYDDNNLKAKVLLHNNANEKIIKSGELEKYKVLHFATHGFVNSERPELSGLLLEQDTTSGEDGILYSGEIYNLKLNANLVVLSACETGLGKIQKGEGIIGLTRALLYAGAKNIIVSLWPVADESTSDLMVDFYKIAIESKGQLSYSEALRNAKLNMISKGKYAHPLFWSPFIFIGK